MKLLLSLAVVAIVGVLSMHHADAACFFNGYDWHCWHHHWHPYWHGAGYYWHPHYWHHWHHWHDWDWR